MHIANQTTWNNGAYMEYAFEPRVEAIARPFNIFPGVAIPIGRYDWTQHLLLFESDHSKALSGSIRYNFGGFWSGSQRNAQVSLLYRPTFRLVFDLGLQVTDISLQICRTRNSRRRWSTCAPAIRSARTCFSTRCCSIATT